MGAIIKREIGAYFTSAIAYVVMAVFFLFSGYFFWNLLYYDTTSITYYVFSQMFMIVLFILPILTMRLFSEEKKQRTDQILLTSPVSVWKIVLCKFIAADIIFLCCMAIYIPMVLVVNYFAAPNWGMIVCNLIGMFLLASAIIAIGIFISSLTESQIVAAVAGIATALFISMMDTFSSAIQIEFIQNLINSLSFMTRYQDFYSGLLSLADVVFYLSVVGLFLFFTTRVIDRKRYS